MNIFYLDKDPIKSAEYQYNKHVVKMILESAQMLCTAHRFYGNNNVPYKSTHLNHPSSVWVRESDEHYDWLYNHMLALGREYTRRYNKKHLSITKCTQSLFCSPQNIPYKKLVQPPQCMPDEYKDKCSVQAYWNYYIGEKHTVANPKKEYIYQKIPMAIAI